MKTTIAIVLSGLLGVACTTTQTVETRKRERAAAYAELSSNEKLAVDQGQLRHGMTTSAAYLTWGEPSEIQSSGATTTWIYRQQDWREEKSTVWRSSGKHAFPEQTRTLFPQERTRARIVFEDGKVKSWHLSNP